MEKYYCTPEGYQQLSVIIEKITKQEIPAIIERISESTKEGGSDLSENSDYLQAKDELDRAEHKARKLTHKTSHASIIDIKTLKPNGKVIFGCTVEIEDVDTAIRSTYKLVGEDESDVKESKISAFSPIGKELIGKRIDDEIEVVTPSGERYFTVISIKHI
jgi:transcription elongation factor GreA